MVIQAINLNIGLLSIALLLIIGCIVLVILARDINDR